MAAVLISVMTSRQECLARYPVRSPASGRANFNAFDTAFLAAAEKRAVPSEFLKAIAWCESRLDPCAVSPMGAQGLMEFMPSTFAPVSVASRSQNPFDPKDSIEAAGVYLATLLNFWRGDIVAAAASYNAGPRAVYKARLAGRAIPRIAETEGYVSCVTAAYTALGGKLAPKVSGPSMLELFAALLKPAPFPSFQPTPEQADR